MKKDKSKQYFISKKNKILYFKMSKLPQKNNDFFSESYLKDMNKQIRNMKPQIDFIQKMDLKPIIKNIEYMNNIKRSFTIPKVPIINQEMSKSIKSINRIMSDAIRNQINLINSLKDALNFDEFNEIISNFSDNLKSYIEYSQDTNLCVSLLYMTDYYHVFVKDKEINNEVLNEIFEEHYPSIKEDFYNNEFYIPKRNYINQIIENFEAERYIECSMLLLSVIDYMTIYEAFHEHREPKYKRLDKIVQQNLEEGDHELDKLITQFAINTIRHYYSSDNNLNDPDYVNRNRLMHGIMDIENITKTDCIKLIYLLDILPTLDIRIKNDESETDTL